MRKRTVQFPGIPPDAKVLVSIDEAATMLSVGRSMIYQLLGCQEIGSIKVGRHRRIIATTLYDYVERQFAHASQGRKGVCMAGRRANQEGTITKRSDGRWEARIMLDDGARKSFYGKTRQEVARKLAEALRDRDKGLPILGDRQTVAQYLESWLIVVKSKVRPRTWKRYEQYVRVHMLPTIGGITLSKLTAQHIQALYAARLAQGSSTTTVRHLHMALHAALEAALRLGLVQRNVSDLVDPPRMRRGELVTLTPGQARSFLAAAEGDPLEALFVLAVTTGMRQGELLGLKWRAVDLDRGVIQVRATVQRTPDGLGTAEPKTARSRRKLLITAHAIDALRRHRVRQAEQRLALGSAWEDNDRVFCNSIGRPIEAGNLLRRHYWPLLERAGLPRMRFHDLRHTAASILLLQGIHPKVDSEMLGHSSVSITLDIYSHVLPDMQREAVDAMARLLQGDDAKLSSKLSSTPRE